MITVVCWKWHQPEGRHLYTAEHVNILYNMIDRNYSGEWEMICFTNDAAEINTEIKVYPLPHFYANIQNPFGPEFPRCFRRLAMFGPLQKYITDKFISIDLDCIITGDLKEIFDRDENIVFWESPLRAPDYNGSIWMAKKGQHPELFYEFCSHKSPIQITKNNKKGSDQGWFSLKLPGESVWTSAKDGIYAWIPQIINNHYRKPKNAKIVFFPGKYKPWDNDVIAKASWIKEYYY